MPGNLFLDFFNRDSREIYGLFVNAGRERHVRLLTEAANVAAFLCEEYCILPPGFLAECAIGREATLRRAAYVTERLIRLPLREETLDAFWEKKRKQYGPLGERYSGLFEHRNEVLLRRFAAAVVTRNTRIADEILRTWEEGPDVCGVWEPIKHNFTAKEVEIIRQVPRKIHEEETAVTWSAISQRLKALGTEVHSLRHVLQNNYFQLYIQEYGLRILTRLPFTRVEFIRPDFDLSNDYEALKAALAALDLWNIIPNLSAEAMISLRSKAGYYLFRRVFDSVAQRAARATVVGEAFARAGTQRRTPRGLKRLLGAYGGQIVPDHGYEPTESETAAIAERLANTEAAHDALMNIMELEHRKTKPPEVYKRSLQLAIYVALELERDILVKRWGLTSSYPDTVWRGKLGKVDVLLFGSGEMGRVSAAVATMRFLQAHSKPDMMLVTGIAGGFERARVQRGHVLIATSVVDLASRKIRQQEEVLVPEFRPTVFPTDDRILKYLNTGSFEKRKWEQGVTDEAEWPEGLRPAIHKGPLASLDEVVSSDHWVTTLCKVWPKLLGVEMESGGVCAAASEFKINVAVVRAVSDLADPAKSDDSWRNRAMKTVAHLLEHIDFAQLLGEP